jgi:hypothetical protein
VFSIEVKRGASILTKVNGKSIGKIDTTGLTVVDVYPALP